MRVGFLTIQHRESEFYGRVGRVLEQDGHTVTHLCVSRRAARRLVARGSRAECLLDLADEPADVAAQAAALRERYGLFAMRELYRADPACDGRPEDWCLARTVRLFAAVERHLDAVTPDVVVPEVGNETARRVLAVVARARGIPVVFLLYTIFDAPLRLTRDRLDLPIVDPADLVPLDAAAQAEVHRFVTSFLERATAIRAHRVSRVTRGTLRDFARHVAVKATTDRDNEYLTPTAYVAGWARQQHGARRAARHYVPIPTGAPFVYFPLHLADDYKIRGVIPHCRDQASLIELVADGLPDGHRLVVKEHPMSIGRNAALLDRLAAQRAVDIVDPYTSSHELIRAARAVTVIGSTVGLEALLHERPVLTLGRPFYAGYGLTVDVDALADLPAALGDLFAFRPDRELRDRFLHAAMRACWPGAPVGVDDSQANAQALARSLAAFAAR